MPKILTGDIMDNCSMMWPVFTLMSPVPGKGKLYIFLLNNAQFVTNP